MLVEEGQHPVVERVSAVIDVFLSYNLANPTFEYLSMNICW